MKKLLLFGSAILISSCNNDVPKCSDKQIIDQLKAMIVENQQRELSSKLGQAIDVFSDKSDAELDGKAVEIENKIIEENIERKNDLNIINIITSETNNETKSCTCEATLDNVKPLSIYLFEKYLENGQPINYTVKTTDSGEKLIEIAPIY